MTEERILQIGRISFVLTQYGSDGEKYCIDELSMVFTEYQQDPYYSDDEVESDISVKQAKDLRDILDDFIKENEGW